MMSINNNEIAVTEPLVCYRHSVISTGLRCNQCGRYICVKCARRTAMGYKCPDCVRAIQDKFFNGKWWDYLIAPAIALPLSLAAVAVLTYFLGGYLQLNR